MRHDIADRLAWISSFRTGFFFQRADGLVMREEDLTRELVEKMRPLQAVHYGTFDLAEMKFDTHRREACIYGLQ